MTWELWGLAALFGLVITWTPGPANLSLMAMSASVGFRETRPYLFGIWAGGFAVIALVGLGVGAVLKAEPVLYRALQIIGLAYITWLAFKLARMEGGNASDDFRPSFWAGSVLHPVNPKAYVMNVTAFASFIAPDMAYAPQAALIGGTLAVIMITATTVWAVGGDVLRHWLTRARYARALRQVLAVAMVASVAVPMVLE